MANVTKDIERPLGQPRGKPSGAGSRLPSVRTLAVCGCALALGAVSAAIALRERPFRDPETPQLSATEQATVLAQGDGAKIIHLDPDKAAAAKGVTIVRDPSASGQNLLVAHLPDRALVENSPMGPLPIRSADGRRPVDVYARPWSGTRGAKVAIVIGGLAVSQTGTQAAIEKLPAEVTLAFASQGNSIGRWMQEARRKGHEILIQAPLEPFDYPTVNPGRDTLTVDATADENMERLRRTLSRTTNYTGIMNYMGARFVADAGAMQPLMAELGRRGLLYLDDGSTGRSVAPELGARDRVPVASGDAIIDGDRDREAILRKLDQLEAQARVKGFALGTGSAFDVTVDAVTSWVAEAKNRGIEIVPVSAVAVDPEKG